MTPTMVSPHRTQRENHHEDVHFGPDRPFSSRRHRSTCERPRCQGLLRPAGSCLLLMSPQGSWWLRHHEPVIQSRWAVMQTLMSAAVLGLLPIPPMHHSSSSTYDRDVRNFELDVWQRAFARGCRGNKMASRGGARRRLYGHPEAEFERLFPNGQLAFSA